MAQIGSEDKPLYWFSKDELKLLLTPEQAERIIKIEEHRTELASIYQTYLWQKLDLEKEQLELDKARESRLAAKADK
jgi:hypothetical protein